MAPSANSLANGDALAPAAWRGRRVLVAGGLGFIGANLAHRLVALGADVLIVDSLVAELGGNRFNLHGIADQVAVDTSDLRGATNLRDLVQGRDYVFNLVGQSSHLESMRDPHFDLAINCEAQLNLLEACRQHNPRAKLIHAGTRQVYGKPDYLPVDERHPLRPPDINGINKLAGESYHILYRKVYGLGATSLRLTNVYGPRMRIKDARQTFLGIWLRCIIENRPFEVWGGEQLRDFTYVDDVIDALLDAAVHPATDDGIFNVGGHGAISLNELARQLVAVNGGGEFAIKEFPAERKRIDIGDYWTDDAKFRAATGWTPKVPLAEGLRRSLDYYRRHLDQYI